MKPIKRILVPTDFSTAGQSALDEAMGLARLLDASITLFHAYELPQPIPDAGAAYGPDVIEALDQAARSELERMRDELHTKSADGPLILVKAALGVAHEEIVAEARHGDYDLVIMGTHGRTGWKHLVLGSVAERVVRLSPVAVLTVHAPAVEVSEADRAR